MSSCGHKIFSILCDIIVPETLQEITSSTLLAKVKVYFAPAPCEIVERFKFRKRYRKPISEFLNKLRKWSEFCNFGGTLENRLRDQLVFGIHDDRIQQKLLDSRSLTLQTALVVALSFESAAQGVKSQQFKENFSANKIDRSPAFQQNKCAPFVQKKKRQGAKTYFGKPCYRCLKKHAPKECPFKNAECFACKTTGHIKAACRLRKASTTPKKNYQLFKIKTLQG